MTCIVGCIDPKTRDIYMGADSASASGYECVASACSKVFINGPMILGFTSSWRMGQLLEHALAIPEHRPEVDVMRYMVTTFIDAVRDCLKAGGFARKAEEQEVAGTFLVGYRGRLFKVNGDYHVEEVLVPYNACGCGESVALGALFVTGRGVATRTRVRRALEAAAAFSGAVCPPFRIKVLRGRRR